MKNMKRAMRRHKKQVWIEKRLNKWLSGYSNARKIKEKANARKGEDWLFVRTTGKPCSCRWSCSYFKYRYERPDKSKVAKIIEEEIQLS